MIDKDKNIAFWDRTAVGKNPMSKVPAGMLVTGREFEALSRCQGEEERVRSLFSSKKSSRVLEVGSGGGRWGFFFADKVKDYVGIDISPNMVRVAEKERSRLDIRNVKFECTDMLSYMPEFEFDMVYFSGVLQYMDDDVVRSCICKAKEMLVPEGVILSRDSVQLRHRVEKSGDYPVIYRTEIEYRKAFEENGFQLEYSDLSYQHRRFTNIASRLYDLPGVSFRMANSLRALLCFVDDAIGNPSFLKTKRHLLELAMENPQEHRICKYVRV